MCQGRLNEERLFPLLCQPGANLGYLRADSALEEAERPFGLYSVQGSPIPGLSEFLKSSRNRGLTTSQGLPCFGYAALTIKATIFCNFLWTRHCVNLTYFISQWLREVGTIITIPILQRWKLRFRAIMHLA